MPVSEPAAPRLLCCAGAGQLHGGAGAAAVGNRQGDLRRRGPARGQVGAAGGLEAAGSGGLLGGPSAGRPAAQEGRGRAAGAVPPVAGWCGRLLQLSPRCLPGSTCPPAARTAHAAPPAPPRRDPIVLPFYHSGMGAVMPKRASLPRAGNAVTVLVGQPLELGDLTCDCHREGVDQKEASTDWWRGYFGTGIVAGIVAG